MAEEKNQVKDNRIKSQKNEVSSNADTKLTEGMSAKNSMAEEQRGAASSEKQPANSENTRSKKTQDAEKLAKKKKAQKKQTMQVIQFVLILALAVGIILAVYIRMTNQSKDSAKYAEENMTELSTLKLYNLESNYPKNPRDVVKLHCRMLKCIYNEKLSNDDYEVLNAQIRKLFSEELLDANPENKNLESLKKEAKDFQNAGKIYISYTVDSESNVHYSTVDGVNYAIVLVNLNIKKSTVSDTLQEEYLLCKENGEWKIVGWQSVSSATISPAN